MTSPTGWALGDARLDAIADIERVSREWPDGIHTCAELQRLEPGRRSCTCGRCYPSIRSAEAAIASAMKAICRWCEDLHFRPYPEQPGSPCNQVQCQCWCTQGTGQ